VNNLLGDAISLSGDIGSMVRLALEIRRLLAAYQARLAREVSSEVVAREVAAIEIRFAQELAAAAAPWPPPRRRWRAPLPGPRSAPRRAWQRLARRPTRRAWSRRARAGAGARPRRGAGGGSLHQLGPAPLVMVIDDEVFGRNRVAIADKINESARGTARASAARARADALLAAERGRPRQPAPAARLEVFVGQTPSLLIPPDAEAAALRAAAAGDLAGALRSLAGPVRDAVAAAARAAAEGSGDLYNSGAALGRRWPPSSRRWPGSGPCAGWRWPRRRSRRSWRPAGTSGQVPTAWSPASTPTGGSASSSATPARRS